LEARVHHRIRQRQPDHVRRLLRGELRDRVARIEIGFGVDEAVGVDHARRHRNPAASRIDERPIGRRPRQPLARELDRRPAFRQPLQRATIEAPHQW
jgi:hypothetical protein